MQFTTLRAALDALKSQTHNENLKWEALAYILEETARRQDFDLDYESEEEEPEPAAEPWWKRSAQIGITIVVVFVIMVILVKIVQAVNAP